MQCNSCGSKWESKNIVTICPFCGVSLVEIPKEENIEMVLKYIVDTQGVDIYTKPSALLGIISDILPKAIDERRLIKYCLDVGIINELLSITTKDKIETLVIQKRASKKLQERCFLNKMMADRFVYWISFSLGYIGENNRIDLCENDEIMISSKESNVTEWPFTGVEYRTFKQKLKNMREKATAIEERLIVDLSVTLALNLDGSISSTVVLDDSYDIFSNCMDFAKRWRNIVSINYTKMITNRHVIGLKQDGTVLVTRGRDGKIDEDMFDGSTISQWTDIKEIFMDYWGVYGLRKDGTILASIILPEYIKHYYHGQDITETLSDVEKVLWTYGRLICLKKDGTLVATNFIGKIEDDRTHWDEIKDWLNIKELYNISGRMIGIRNDGTLVATRRRNEPSDSFDFWTKISNWRNICLFYWSEDELVALTEEGKILYASSDNISDSHSFFKDMRSWENIVKVYFGVGVAAGLRADGSIIVTNYYGEKDGLLWEEVSKWTDLIGLVPGFRRVVGIKKDGTLIHVGDNDHGQGNVENFNLLHP